MVAHSAPMFLPSHMPAHGVPFVPQLPDLPHLSPFNAIYCFLSSCLVVFATVDCGVKPGRFETFNHALSHEFGGA